MMNDVDTMVREFVSQVDAAAAIEFARQYSSKSQTFQNIADALLYTNAFRDGVAWLVKRMEEKGYL